MKTFISLLICSVCILCYSAVNCVESSPKQNNYTVTEGNVTCVVMTTALQLTIPYVGQTKNLTSQVNIPSNFSSNGSCANKLGQNTLNIYFFDDSWSIAIILRNTTDNSYEWAEVKLTYRLDATHFPNVSTSQVNKTVQVDTMLPNSTDKAPMSGSYQCDGSSVLQLQQSITLTLVNLHYRAFGVTNSTGFSTYNVQSCASGENPATPVGVTVSIGIAIGVLIVVVIVLYLMADKILSRRKPAYD